MKITSEVKSILNTIEYGLYRSSNEKVSEILKTQFLVSSPKSQDFEVIENELSTYTGKDNLTKDELRYTEFLYASLSYLHSLNKEYTKASDILTQGVPPLKFQSIRTIHLYYTYLTKLDNNSDKSLEIVTKLLLSQFTKYPSRSNMLDRYYLNQLLHSFFQKLHKEPFQNLVSIFHNNYNLIITYSSFAYHNTKSASFLKDLQSYITKINQDIIKTHKFPKANEISDQVENFIVTISNNNELYSVLSTKNLKDIIVGSFSTSFQNIQILKQFILVLVKEKNVDEIKPSLDVYLEYVEKSNLQHGGVYIDLLEIIDLLSKVLKMLVVSGDSEFEAFASSKVATAASTTAVGDKLQEIKDVTVKLDHFLKVLIEELGLEWIYEDQDGKIDRSIADFSQLISESFFSLGISYKFVSKFNSIDSKDLNAKLSRASTYLQYSIRASRSINTEHYFELATIYLKLNKLRKLIKLMKTCCFNDKENFKYWNFLTLLYSTEENYQNLESLINNSILLLNSKLEETDNFVASLSLDAKQDILQLKMTQISLIELMNKKDTAVALQCLPELFQLFNSLFQVNGKEQRAKNSNGSTISRANSLKSKHNVNGGNGNNLLKKILSRTSTIPRRMSSSTVLSHHLQVKQAQNTSASSASSHPVDQKILQKIWLWSANLYLKAGLLSEAEDCIVEAESAYKLNSATRSKFGMLLLITGNKTSSLIKEFESSLKTQYGSEVENNLEAVLGLSKLILLNPSDCDFVGATDREAAELRLKLLLESLSHSYKYCQVTEIFWYLSMLYEKYQDLDKYQESLWKCIELEENKPVRGFECLEDKVV